MNSLPSSHRSPHRVVVASLRLFSGRWVSCLRLRSLFSVVAFFLLSASVATAQWATQSIVLEPGWNAVYLEVQPEPRECDAVFAELPVESVWA